MNQFDRVLDKLQTTSPVSIMVSLPMAYNVADFQRQLRETDIDWRNIRRGFMEAMDGSKVILVSNDQARRGIRGYTVDYLSLHDETTWVAVLALRPCADSLI